MLIKNRNQQSYNGYWNAPDNRRVTIKKRYIWKNGREVMILTAVYSVKIGYMLMTPVCHKWADLKTWLKNNGYYWNGAQVRTLFTTQESLEEAIDYSPAQTMLRQALNELMVKQNINEFTVVDI